MPTQLTIVIPAKNEAERLPRLLASLALQDYLQAGDTKVYVADAGSTDGTAAIAESFRGRLDVVVIPGGLPAVGRNAGALLATTPYLLFLDADVEFDDPTLLRRAVEAADERGLHCVTTNIGCIPVRGSKSFSNHGSKRGWKDGLWKDEALFRMNNLVQRASRWVSPFATGMFMLFDRAEFERLGGFDVRALYAEDYLLSKQVSRRRFAVIRGRIYTSNRRFERMGHARIARMFLATAINSRNPDYFLRERGYWEPADQA